MVCGVCGMVYVVWSIACVGTRILKNDPVSLTYSLNSSPVHLARIPLSSLPFSSFSSFSSSSFLFKIGRLRVFRRQYAKFRSGQIIRKWGSFVEGKGEGGAARAFSLWLPEFYDAVLSVLSGEGQRCVDIFGSNR